MLTRFERLSQETLTRTLLRSPDRELFDVAMRKKAVAIIVVLVFLATLFLDEARSASGPVTGENSWVKKTPMKTAKADFGGCYGQWKNLCHN